MSSLFAGTTNSLEIIASYYLNCCGATNEQIFPAEKPATGYLVGRYCEGYKTFGVSFYSTENWDFLVKTCTDIMIARASIFGDDGGNVSPELRGMKGGQADEFNEDSLWRYLETSLDENEVMDMISQGRLTQT